VVEVGRWSATFLIGVLWTLGWLQVAEFCVGESLGASSTQCRQRWAEWYDNGGPSWNKPEGQFVKTKEFHPVATQYEKLKARLLVVAHLALGFFRLR
jgi:hypothetical protein